MNRLIEIRHTLLLWLNFIPVISLDFYFLSYMYLFSVNLFLHFLFVLAMLFSFFCAFWWLNVGKLHCVLFWVLWLWRMTFYGQYKKQGIHSPDYFVLFLFSRLEGKKECPAFVFQDPKEGMSVIFFSRREEFFKTRR